MTLQVPAASGMTVAPEIVHPGGVPERTSAGPARKDTASPELAWADTTNGTPTVARAGTLKSPMACDCPCFDTTVNENWVAAGPNSRLPSWAAVMMHWPAARVITVNPDTAHAGGNCAPGPVAARRVTASRDVAVTGTLTATPAGTWDAPPARRLVPPAGSIDWAPWPAMIVNERCSSGAAAKRALPSWAAVMAHLPVARVSTVVRDTVHSSGVAERNDTLSREDADADSVTGIPAITPARVPSGRWNVIICGVRPVPIRKVRAIPAAANAESPGWVAVIVQAPAPTAVAEPVVVGPADGGAAGHRADRWGVRPERDRQPG